VIFKKYMFAIKKNALTAIYRFRDSELVTLASKKTLIQVGKRHYSIKFRSDKFHVKRKFDSGLQRFRELFRSLNIFRTKNAALIKKSLKSSVASEKAIVSQLSSLHFGREQWTKHRLGLSRLFGVKISPQSFAGLDLSGTDLSKMDFSGSDLSKCNLVDTNLSHTDLRGAIISHVDLENTTITNFVYDARTNFDESKLSIEQWQSLGFIEKEATLLQKHGLSPAHGRRYQRQGIPINESTMLGRFRQAAAKASGYLGEGACSTVQRIQYGGNSKTYHRAYKSMEHINTTTREFASDVGIDSEEPNFEIRNLATRSVNTLLGFSVIGHYELGQDESGTLGVVAPIARGDNAAFVLKQFPELANDAVLRREIIKLQIVDMLTGQLDRHSQNYFIERDSNGGCRRIRGIDNDFSFSPNKKSISDIGVKPFTVIDEEMRCLLLAISEKDFINCLDGLSAQEKASSLLRLRELKTHVEELSKSNRIISPDEWGTGRVGDWLFNKNNGVTNYLARDVRRSPAHSGSQHG